MRTPSPGSTRLRSSTDFVIRRAGQGQRRGEGGQERGPGLREAGPAPKRRGPQVADQHCQPGAGRVGGRARHWRGRKNLLNEALRLLRTVNETPGNTAKLLAQRLVAHNQMGQIYWRSKDVSKPRSSSRWRAIWRCSAEARSGQRPCAKDLAATTLKVADVFIYYRDEAAAARPLLRECEQLYEAMVAELRHAQWEPQASPRSTRCTPGRRARACRHLRPIRRGRVAPTTLRRRPSGWKKAKAIRQRLYDETDRADFMRRDAQVSILGQSIMLLASLRYAQGNLKAHLAGRKQVALLRREVAEHRPNSLRALGLWAAAEGDLSDALLLSGQPREALASAEKSLQVLQQVAAAHPEDLDYRGRVAHAYYRTAVGWMRLGDRKAALGEFQKSLAIRQKLHDEQPDLMIRQTHKAPIMLLVARCGDPARAEKLGWQRDYLAQEEGQ